MGFQDILSPFERHFKQGRTSLDRLCTQRLSIQGQFNLGSRREDLHRLYAHTAGFLSATDLPVRAPDPDERVLAKKCLVQPITVLGSPVGGGNSLAVEMRNGKSPGLRTEVVQVPDRPAGKILLLQDNRDIALVEEESIIAGIILTFRVETVQTRIRVGAIFGNDQGLSGECLVYLVKGRAQFVECAVIPTMVEIESQDVRDVSKPAFLVPFPVTVTRNHRGPRRIGLAQGTVDSLSAILHSFVIVLLSQFLPRGIVQKHFVHVCPGHDGRMVIILVQHLPGHVHAVPVEIIGKTDAVDDRNLHTGEDSQAVTSLRNQIILRVMRNPEEIAAHLLEKTDVTKVHFVPKRIPLPPKILMPVGSHELKVPAVQEESFIRVEAERPDAERTPTGIHHLPVLVQKAGYDRIQHGRIDIP